MVKRFFITKLFQLILEFNILFKRFFYNKTYPITPRIQYNCLDTRESCLFNLPCDYILFTYYTLINFVSFLSTLLYFCPGNLFIEIRYCCILKAVMWNELYIIAVTRTVIGQQSDCSANLFVVLYASPDKRQKLI